MKTIPTFLNKILALFAGAIILTSCNYSDVEVKGVEDFTLEKMDMSGATIRGKVRVINPNNYKIKVSNSDSDLYLNGQLGGTATLLGNIVVPANHDGPVNARMRAEFSSSSVSMIPLIMGIMRGNKVHVKLVGTVKAKSFVVGKKVPFEVEADAKF